MYCIKNICSWKSFALPKRLDNITRGKILEVVIYCRIGKIGKLTVLDKRLVTIAKTNIMIMMMAVIMIVIMIMIMIMRCYG